MRAAVLILGRFYLNHRRRFKLLGLGVAGVAALLLAQALLREAGWLGLPAGWLDEGLWLAVFCAALACEYLDSSLGMGYGTTLTPLLLLLGFEPLAIVPAVLLSELVTGLAAGIMHHRDGNIDLIGDLQARRGAPCGSWRP